MKTIRDLIATEVSLGYALTTQADKRGFSGSAAGKGRRPQALQSIAARIAANIHYAMIVTRHGKIVEAGDIAGVVAQALAAITPEAAYATLLRGDGQPNKARDEMTAIVVDATLRQFEIEKKEFTGLNMIASMPNGPGIPKDSR